MSTAIETEIMTVSGTYSCQCSCEKCKNLCRTPCLGTPEDISALISAGYESRLAPILWGVGMLAGLIGYPIKMIQPKIEDNGWCTFRTADGLCELHDKGLKPLEGKLASCRPKPANWDIRKDYTWLIAKTWLPLQQCFVTNK